MSPSVSTGEGDFSPSACTSGDVRRPQEFVDLRHIPGRIAHFEDAAQVTRQSGEEHRKPVVVALHPRRGLEEDRSEALAEQARALEEDRQRLRGLPQLLAVRDLLRGLQAEDEVFGRRRSPLRDVLLRREVIEGVVDLDRAERRVA